MKPVRLPVFLCLALIILGGCGRPPGDDETDFAAMLFGEALDADRVRMVEGAPVASVTFKRQKRPRLACRERILPEPTTDIVTASPAAVSLWNRIFFARDWYLDDYLDGYPKQINLTAAMLYVHEMTHVWQWQNRDLTGYSPLRAAAEHGGNPDPYLFDVETSADFLSFGFEQQGAIMEEYICCRALAPQSERTQRLHAMLTAVMPVRDLPQQGREWDVWLPWDGVEVKGICD